ncbi:GntR family transcriptional regulator [Clostridium sp.]|uniref:GntR family transcriptional regulator n=1 Tax=Clostridium sp. TaxID=1506 RepID=UPI002909FD98|nr:GntR family transcriptional regulator [Clostridium sp.]MDU5106730.1 GntR family transcriptional regulator [Clostridium sp.]
MKSDKVPLHLHIKEDILSKIQSGTYRENEIIPNEITLASQYNVSRPTIRQAIQGLVNEGYLERKKRKGTVVIRKKIPQEFTHILQSYNNEIREKGLEPKTMLISCKLEEANSEIIEKLNLEEGEKVYKIVRLRYAGDDPIVFVSTYLKASLFPDLLKYDFNKESLYNVLSLYDNPILSITRYLEVMKADESTSVLLDIEKGDPIFKFISIGYTHNRNPIEYSIAKYRGDLNSFVIEIDSSKNV